MLHGNAFFKPLFRPNFSDKPDLMQVLVLQDMAHVFYIVPAIEPKTIEQFNV